MSKYLASTSAVAVVGIVVGLEIVIVAEAREEGLDVGLKKKKKLDYP